MIKPSTQLARKLRKDQTSTEEMVWKMLKRRKLHGLKFRRQHPIGPYVADFYCKEINLIIEVDGSVHDETDQKEHDRIRDHYLVQKGYNIFHIKNNSIWTNGSADMHNLYQLTKELFNTSPAHTGTLSPSGEGGSDGKDGNNE